MSKRKQNPTESRTTSKKRIKKTDPRNRKTLNEMVKKGGNDAILGIITPSTLREIVESVVIAFVLAFLFRTFEAEAFVIPTGSMAPTLMGRHKDVLCEQCGFPFQISASEEVSTPSTVLFGTCPICRYTMNVDAENSPHPSYKGDRILVSKFAYEFQDPQRWDVAVFKFPGGAKTNYIKRIVGLPGETIRVRHGDLYVEKEGQPEKIARKTPRKVRAMLQPVYDNDHILPLMVEGTWPARWTSSARDSNESGRWIPSEDGKSFSSDTKSSQTAWLQYQHRVPSITDWNLIEDGGWQAGYTIDEQLITDFTAYNTGKSNRGKSNREPSSSSLGLHWVGDLAVEYQLEVIESTGYALIELVEGGHRFQCHIDLTTGEATLSTDTGQTATTQTRIDQPDTYKIMFANVDDQLLLWVDGKVTTLPYDPIENTRPWIDDLQPVRIGAEKANIRIDHLKLFRDIHYIAQTNPCDRDLTDFPRNTALSPYRIFPPTPSELRQVMSTPSAWIKFDSANELEFKLEADQFLAFGDNSAASKDSRLWEEEHYVKRELLIGKALVIYWPHSLNKIPGTSIPIRLFPNFWRMWFVR